MARHARIVIPGTPHHVTQRGNRRQPTFFRDADYRTYLRIAADSFGEAGVEVWAYCLMPNHVHLIATPTCPKALATAVGITHQRYTRHINRREGWAGYLWQGRFASFPMDDDHLRTCVRYVGLNPVRSGLVGRAVDWRWSSVRAHLGQRPDPLLTLAPLQRRLIEPMDRFFDLDVDEEARRKLRRASSSGCPLGAAAWIRCVEAAAGRTFVERPVGIGDTQHFSASVSQPAPPLEMLCVPNF